VVPGPPKAAEPFALAWDEDTPGNVPLGPEVPPAAVVTRASGDEDLTAEHAAPETPAEAGVVAAATSGPPLGPTATDAPGPPLGPTDAPGPPLGPTAAPVAPAVTMPLAPAWEPPTTPKKRRTWLWVSIAALVIVIAAIVAVFFLTRGVSVPNVVGLPSQPAKAKADEARLTYTMAGLEFTTLYQPGVVMRQYPAPDAQVRKGATLSVVLATNAHVTTVPRAVTQALPAALQALDDAGLTLGAVKTAASDKPLGTVLLQDPEPAVAVGVGSSVALTVSTGPSGESLPVPNLVGMDVTVAQKVLEALGLKGSTATVDSSWPANRIIAQNPAPGSLVETGATIGATVSNGSTAESTTSTTGGKTTTTKKTSTTGKPAASSQGGTSTSSTGTGTSTSSSTGSKVGIQDLAFVPQKVTVNAGGKVTWLNQDSVDHKVVADDGGFQSKVLAPGQSFSATFDTPGTNPYHCAIHTEMAGTVVVK
jgi:beta-lactam-binding protein with PASTA domain